MTFEFKTQTLAMIYDVLASGKEDIVRKVTAAMPDNIRLITRADDCGSNHSANLGIMEATRAGLLKNISVMVTCPFVEEAAAMFAGRAEFCFGLHATLNAEWDAVKWGPVLPPEQVPSLLDEHGLFFPGPHVFREHPRACKKFCQNCRHSCRKRGG